MKISILVGIACFLVASSFTEVAYGQAQKSSSPCLSDEDGCDFSRYKRLKEPDSLFKAIVKRVDPEYPPAARFVRASGKVIVRILVNKKGNVVRACMVEGHPLLRAASLQAATQWKFKKNFGFVDSKLKERFAEAVLTFNFELP